MGSDVESKAGRRRCVVWHRAGVEASKPLGSALGSRGLGVETSGSGHEVLAMGCAQQRKGLGLIVVLDGGGQELVDQGRVLESMERFCPSVVVWVYEEGANPPMRGFVGVGGKKPIAATVDRGQETPAGNADGHGLRMAGSGGGMNGGAGNGLKSGVNGSGLRASDVLDGDELAALLKPRD